ncbi:HNH endonuclease signature motif containing protein [Chamaesiphon sp. VAR_48_metabat_403]|uniref:HNH endonuclease signature motif containing protein n=1 Tax=Chamaesiphon sp. VAR_48_metabat_403 TaxID=2964700 RepID=UPI00286EA045|nr:HNH endonuclease signature motif containing protein [Chamaesiphon sp. VAR_48_metabat_403]
MSVDIEIDRLEKASLRELFKLADQIGNKHYHRLTPQDFQKYLQYNAWRYINGDYECGSTEVSKLWVKNNSSLHCPVCRDKYASCNYKTIDHKLPRSHYPWLSMEFDNLWVICKDCNIEKSDLNWFEYEQYICMNYSHRYATVEAARPWKMLRSLQMQN